MKSLRLVLIAMLMALPVRGRGQKPSSGGNRRRARVLSPRPKSTVLRVCQWGYYNYYPYALVTRWLLRAAVV